MSERPSNKLDPRIKAVWRINDAIWITVMAACAFSILAALMLIEEAADVVSLLMVIAAVVFAVLYVCFIAVLPQIRYMRWRYEITPEYLVITKGIIWREHFVIPFIRVQNTDTRQGPLMRAFKLASVTVATAAKEHVIPGLSVEVASTLRDKAAEFARLAREDV